ncbi:Rossmann-fold NAD(P)-binding domain-containing protein [Cyclobacterium marinum]|uniref:hypothetical protein n=1 Tax=Cyclobacterium marinum TaxID=104 RepID=UPI0011EEFB51|nr:hypothetical protein [Cyclobacterium marinum]MBI0398171.1 hypothetical protein [Cyclobacterium marinum]
MMGQFRLMSFSTNLYNLKSDAFYLDFEETKQLMLELKSWPEIQESFILSLPERIEILYYSNFDLEDKIFEAVADCKGGNVLPIKSEFNQTSDEEKLFIHLSELCFGVQASNYGTTPLFPQFSKAYDFAAESGMIGEYLEQWWDNLISTDKLLKEQADYQLPNFSISYIVSDLLTELVNNVRGPKIAIIGFNALSKRIYRNLSNQGYGNITIVDKSITSCLNFKGKELNNFTFEPLNKVENVIGENDILISTLEDADRFLPSYYFKHDFLDTKIFIDLSIKSTITSVLSDYNQVIPFNLTDIYKIIEQKMEINKKWLKKAKPLVIKKNQKFFDWIDNKKAQKMLGLIKTYLKENVNQIEYSKVLTSNEPLSNFDLVHHKRNKILLKKSIEKIKRNTQYKDIINYDKIVNEFYQYN